MYETQSRGNERRPEDPHAPPPNAMFDRETCGQVFSLDRTRERDVRKGDEQRFGTRSISDRCILCNPTLLCYKWTLLVPLRNSSSIATTHDNSRTKFTRALLAWGTS